MHPRTYIRLRNAATFYVEVGRRASGFDAFAAAAVEAAFPWARATEADRSRAIA
jgi:hypothetical protein